VRPANEVNPRHFETMKAPLIYQSLIATAACLGIVYGGWTYFANIRKANDGEKIAEAGVNVDTQQPAQEIRKWAAGLAPSDDPAATDLERRTALALRSGEPDDSLKLLAALTYVDPMAAARVAQSQGSLREAAIRIVVQNWASLDRGDAERWAAQLQNPDERDTALSYLCYQVSQSDPAQAIKIAADHGISGQRGLIQNLAEQWAAKDFFSAGAWASTLSTGDERDQIYMRLALVLSKAVPREAAQLVLDEIKPGVTQSEAAISVLHQWTLRDYEGAAAWVAQFPDGELRERALQELAGFETSKSP
jgi:hypothetical protein